LRSGTITDVQTLDLRGHIYKDSKISEVEADWLFELNATCTEQQSAFSTLFVEALSDYIVHQTYPDGYITDANAAWLISRIDKDGKLETKNELELLLAVFEKAKSVPETMSAYALDQVRQAIISGEGVTRSGKTLVAGKVDEADIEILRRILYAYGSGGNIGITAAEAEVLFDINDATATADNHPAWPVLFAQAIANYLMMAQGHQAMSREETIRVDKWVDEPQKGVGHFISAMVAGLRGIYTHAEKPKVDKPRFSMTESEQITEFEANWLVERIRRDANLSEAEKAVLAFIREESPNIHPALKPLIEQAA
jgi:hypothetical protein